MICQNGRVNILGNTQNNNNYIIEKKPINNNYYKNCPNFTSYKDALNGNLENTPLSIAFFSSKNIEIIQNAIKKGVYQKSNKLIDTQDEMEIKIIMRSIFLQGCINTSQSLTRQIEALNMLVIKYCVTNIYNTLISYYKYREDASIMALPHDNPILSNMKNKTLELKPWF